MTDAEKSEAEAVPAGDTSHRQRMLSGRPYIASADPQIAADSMRARQLLSVFNATGAEESDERRRLLHDLLGAFGDESEIRPPFYCDYGDRIRVGARVFANFGLVALDVATIDIGDDVQIGPNVQLLTPTHPLEAEARRAKWEAAEPISVGDNAWLGGGVIVLPGVAIGRDTVVGAGAVVSTDLPAGVLAVGNPARVVRPL